MPNNIILFQYQIKAEAPPSAILALPRFESTFHQAWSEPVRFKVAPRLAIALIASGAFAPVFSTKIEPGKTYESPWHQPWSEPVRLKPGLRAQYQQTYTNDNRFIPLPSAFLQGTQNWWDAVLPNWPKKGLRRELQQTLAQPPRLLPTPNVTARMAATETNADVASFVLEINVNVPKPYVLFAGANVTITNIPAIKGGAMSIEEND